MGYLTRFSLEVDASDNLKPVHGVDKDGNPATIYLRESMTIDDYEKFITVEAGFNPFEDECKWYDHEVDMRTVSHAFPNTLFTLTGEGEENGDMWVKYFKYGKIQRAPAKITYDEFDEAKLV